MGFELYRMIRDGAPEGWTPLMRLLAMVIADDAWSQEPPGDDGCTRSAIAMRGGYRNGEWRDGLTERTGLSERAVSRVLTELARAGYEMREQIGTSKRGRPVFAYPGRRARFRVPLLTPRECPPDPATICPPDMATICPPDPATTGRGGPPILAGIGEQAMPARSGSNARQIRRPSRGSPDSAGLVPPTPNTSPSSQALDLTGTEERARTREIQTDDFEAERRRQQDGLRKLMRDHPETAGAQPPGSTSAESAAEGESTP